MIDEIKPTHTHTHTHTPIDCQHWFGGRQRNVQVLTYLLDSAPFEGLSAYRERLLRDRIDADLDEARKLLDLLGDYPQSGEVITHFMSSRILDQLTYRQTLLDA